MILLILFVLFSFFIIVKSLHDEKIQSLDISKFNVDIIDRSSISILAACFSITIFSPIMISFILTTQRDIVWFLSFIAVISISAVAMFHCINR